MCLNCERFEASCTERSGVHGSGDIGDGVAVNRLFPIKRILKTRDQHQEQRAGGRLAQNGLESGPSYT